MTRATNAVRAERALASARYARREHSLDCLLWDYEGSACEECERHDESVRVAKARLQRVREGKGETVAR